MTGSGQTSATSDRVAIYEREGQIKAITRLHQQTVQNNNNTLLSTGKVVEWDQKVARKKTYPQTRPLRRTSRKSPKKDAIPKQITTASKIKSIEEKLLPHSIPLCGAPRTKYVEGSMHMDSKEIDADYWYNVFNYSLVILQSCFGIIYSCSS